MVQVQVHLTIWLIYGPLLTNSAPGSWNYVSGGINPCSGCHNPHRAQKDPHTSTGRLIGGKLVSSVSRPSLHSKNNNAWYLWGEDYITERMCMPMVDYKATCRYPWSDPCSSFEPDGSSTSDGTNMVDSNYICLDCHQNQIYSTPQIDRLPVHTLQAIQSVFTLWTGDIHGGASQTCCDWGDKKAPYVEGQHYTLSCLDCHEPHGSPNEYLLRQEVNGVQIPNFGRDKYYNFCQACHINMNKHMYWDQFDSNSECWLCHRHGASQSACVCSPAKTF